MDCLEDDLAALTNRQDAGEFVDACEHLSRIKHRLINA